jgi:serine/threonine protein kinase
MNIAHRDIKLANILVNDEFEIKLADLGFAKVSQGEDVLKSYAGTPLIMAP